MTAKMAIAGVIQLSRAELLEAIENHLRQKSEKLRGDFVFSFLDEAENNGAQIVFRERVKLEK